MTNRIPDPIAAYFAAEQAHDFAALALCFAADGTVRDEGAVQVGRAAITAWAAKAYSQYHHESEVIGSREQDGVHIVSVRVSGQFPGSPVQLTQSFNLAEDEIRSLEIA